MTRSGLLFPAERSVRFLLLAALVVGPIGCGLPRSDGEEAFAARDDVALERLAERVWMHETVGTLADGSRVAANGLVVVGDRGAILVDTGWDDTQAAAILEWARHDLAAPIVAAVVTHAHDDRDGGIERVRAEGVEVLEGPSSPADGPLLVERAGARLELFHPGPAHAPDNVVVWLPASRVLFGGCMVRAAAATGPGNLADADLARWPAAVDRLIERYGAARVVVSGHGRPGDAGLLRHTRVVVSGAASAAPE
ncbi:MAG: MBL fold metallo-hydrolase [Planctomycetota bacterium JB042]